MLTALADYEAQIDEYGFLLSEVTSKDADPDNPQGTVRFEAESYISWSAYAVAAHLKTKGDDDPYRSARKVRVRRTDRS